MWVVGKPGRCLVQRGRYSVCEGGLRIRLWVWSGGGMRTVQQPSLIRSVQGVELGGAWCMVSAISRMMSSRLLSIFYALL